MSYHIGMAENGEVASLDLERSRKFLRTLAEDPFIAVVVAEDGEVRVFSKGIEPDHLARIKSVLTDLTREEDTADGEDEDPEG